MRSVSYLVLLIHGIGLLVGGLIHFAGGMKTIPGLTIGEYIAGVAISIFAILFSIIILAKLHNSDDETKGILVRQIIALTLSILLVGLFIWTYFDYGVSPN